MRIIVVLDENM